jgi:hypothetical protein
MNAGGTGHESLTGRGEAADGQIQATATRGRLESLELNPRLMRLSGEQLAGYVAVAIDAALEEACGEAPAIDGPPVDPSALAARLSAAQDQSRRTVATLTQELGEAVALLRERTGMEGDVSPRGLSELPARPTRDRPDDETGGSGGVGDAGDGDEVSGRGESADGQVHATLASLCGRITALDISDRAMRAASHVLAGQITIAINEALTDLRAKLRERGGSTPVDPRRLAALREASTRQMAAYARSLRDLIAADAQHRSVRQLIDEAEGMTFGEPRRSVLHAVLAELDTEPASPATTDDDVEASAVVLAMLAQQDSGYLAEASRALHRAEARGAELNWIQAHLAEAYFAAGDPDTALQHASAVRRRFFDERDLHWRSVRMDEIQAASWLALARFDDGLALAERVAAELAQRGDLDDLAAPTALTRTALSMITDRSSPMAADAGCRVLTAIAESIELSSWFAPDYAAELAAGLASCGDGAAADRKGP